MPRISGQAFNIGGGPERTRQSARTRRYHLELARQKPRLYFEPSRTGDQRYYVSDTSKFREATGWQPRVCARDGVRRLFDWLVESRRVVTEELAAS